MRQKKLIGVLFALMIVLAIMPCVASASSTKSTAKSDKIIHSGKSGDIEWSINENGEFILEGDGSLETKNQGSFCVDKNGYEFFIPNNYMPWLEYSDKIVHAKINVKNPKSLAGILSNCYNLETVDFSGSDTSKTIDFACMISTDFGWSGKSNKLETLDLSMLDTSSAIRMTQLLWGCTNLEYVDVSGWDTSNITDMGSAFDCCLNLKTIKGIEEWDTSNVVQMYTMFQSCNNLKALDLSSWNTKNLSAAYSMFSNCQSLESLDVSTWDVSKVSDFRNMFYCNVNLESLDLTNWDMQNALYIDCMFGWCYKLSGGITFNSNIQSYNLAFYAAATNSDERFIIDYKGDCSKALATEIYNTNADYNHQSKLKLYSCKDGHEYDTAYIVDLPGTTTENGRMSQHCKNCNAKRNEETICKLGTVKLESTTYVYNGKIKSPTVVVKDSQGNTISSKNYKVTKSKGRKNVGKYTYKITFKNQYKGSKTLAFTINPKATSVKSLRKDKQAFTVKWGKVSKQATGYEVMYSTSKNFKKGKLTKTKVIKKAWTTSLKVTKLKAKTKYYVKVRTYKTVKINGKNVKICSDWSKVKSVKTK